MADNFEKDINVPSKRLHGNRKDLTGLKVGKLTCLEPVKTGKNNHSEWLCECECGNFKIVQTYRLLAGRIQSCGDCYHSVNHYIPMIKELKEKLLHKEQECEELKNFHINLVGVKECEIKELFKLKQTLTEIKEIAEFGFRPYKVCGEHNNCCDVLNEILQKISECEGNDE